jgi:ribosomal protein S24E
MPGILKSEISTYEFSLEQMKQLIAADLNVDPNRVTVRYVLQEVGADPMDRFPGRTEVTRVEVSVKKQGL